MRMPCYSNARNEEYAMDIKSTPNTPVYLIVTLEWLTITMIFVDIVSQYIFNRFLLFISKNSKVFIWLDHLTSNAFLRLNPLDVKGLIEGSDMSRKLLHVDL